MTTTDSPDNFETLFKAFGPNGVPIVGTLESVHGTCYLRGFERNEHGGFTPVDDGNGTDLNWDSAMTVRSEGGLKTYVDENGEEWAEDRLTFVDAKGAKQRPPKRKRAYVSPAANIEMALAHLRNARDLLVKAGAPNAAHRVRACLKSAEGAHRHAQGRALDQDRVRIRRRRKGVAHA